MIIVFSVPHKNNGYCTAIKDIYLTYVATSLLAPSDNVCVCVCVCMRLLNGPGSLRNMHL